MYVSTSYNSSCRLDVNFLHGPLWYIHCKFSFCVGELGDYEGMSCRTGYLSEFQFFPGQVCSVRIIYAQVYEKKKMWALLYFLT